MAQQLPEERPPFIALVCPHEGRGGPSLQRELTHISTSEDHHLRSITPPDARTPGEDNAPQRK